MVKISLVYDAQISLGCQEVREGASRILGNYKTCRTWASKMDSLKYALCDA